jgi:DNA-binding NarL/FixJ family response regulator
MAKGPTRRRQLEVLRAYIAAGSIAAAAHELGISETTARQHLSGLYRLTGCLNAAQAAYRLGKGRLRQRIDIGHPPVSPGGQGGFDRPPPGSP